MKVRIFLLMLLIFASSKLFAQCNWQSVGRFNHGVSAFYFDSSENKFYIAGSFVFYNTDTIVGIGVWDGHSFSPVGCGFDYGCSHPDLGPSDYPFPTARMIKYKGDLYATGQFVKADNNIVNGFARWNGTNWEGFGNGLIYFNGKIGSGGIGFDLKIYNNDLYVSGAFDSIAGVEAHGLARFDGTNFYSVNNLPVFNSAEPNWIISFAFYNNEIYVGGNFDSPTDTTLNDLAKWDGSKWVSAYHMIEPSEILYMDVWDNKLIIAGDFARAGNLRNPGNNIASFDGTTWSLMGGGTDKVIADFIIHNNKLYAGGGFVAAGGIPASAIATYDGTKWCAFDCTFNGPIDPIAFYADTLFIAGFSNINGDTSVSKIAEWKGDITLSDCSVTGIKEVGSGEGIKIYPNPAEDYLQLSGISTQNSTMQYSIINTLGQLKQSNTLIPGNTSASVDVSALPVGVYFIRLTDSKGFLYSGKFVKE